MRPEQGGKPPRCGVPGVSRDGALHERIHIADRVREKASVRKIARDLGRAPGGCRWPGRWPISAALAAGLGPERGGASAGHRPRRSGPR
ncbi:helix-turn-helix domain-containing protein [Nonomuraea sp. H19]|uniref:helix-turn-helix domain-containing protein n=1 Tax=Nonomuraea sp. H19 TaxID=3452206 RepID=UPI003F8CED1D